MISARKCSSETFARSVMQRTRGAGPEFLSHSTRFDSFEGGDDLRSKLADAPRAQRENQVAFVRQRGDTVERSGEIGRERDAGTFNAVRKRFRRHSGNGLLARRVYGQHRHAVGIDKRAAELIEQVVGAGVSMRLKDHVDLL